MKIKKTILHFKECKQNITLSIVTKEVCSVNSYQAKSLTLWKSIVIIKVLTKSLETHDLITFLTKHIHVRRIDHLCENGFMKAKYKPTN